MLKLFLIEGRLTLLGSFGLVLSGFLMVYGSLEFLPFRWAKLVGVSLGLALAAVGGLSGRASAIGLPPPFTNDPLSWRAAKKSYDQAPDEPERVKSEEDLPKP